nr:MAG TPA: CRISPR-associated (Cas) DxTHG family [Caudoviricetes sp.]DAY41089.1 MAG TPA: CRISPR-associated (Cas) DxTHG family [Caudoviricetes sp.]
MFHENACRSRRYPIIIDISHLLRMIMLAFTCLLL